MILSVKVAYNYVILVRLLIAGRNALLNSPSSDGSIDGRENNSTWAVSNEYYDSDLMLKADPLLYEKYQYSRCGSESECTTALHTTSHGSSPRNRQLSL